MLRYELNKLGKRKKGTVVELPEIAYSLSLEKAYLKILRQLLKQLFVTTTRVVIPSYKRQLLIQDVDSFTFEQLSRFAESLVRVASSLLDPLLKLEGERHTKRFAASAKKAIGVDLSSVVRNGDLETTLEQIATRNAGLIKGLAQDTVKKVQLVISNAVLEAKPVRILQKELIEEFGFSASRAKLIAVDQTAKITTDLNRIRQKQAGLKKYKWRTSQDEKVRPLHKSLDGRIYKYDEPTGAENGLSPGQPVRCRCVGIGIVEF
jgi:SPP1 gp7 family putative phage head morphogenesis protein